MKSKGFFYLIMSEDEEIYNAWDGIIKTDWKIHETYGQSYITKEEFEKQHNNLSTLRRLKAISIDDRIVINTILDSGRRHHVELKEYLYNAPRREAQKFIGNKDVRKKVFELHGEICLCCGATEKISLDHIVPIYFKGENKIDNLQPLCTSCNSRKGTSIIDYRL